MGNYPLVVWLGSIAQAFPVLTGGIAFRRLTRARLVFFAVAVFGTAATVAQFLIASSRRSNLWLSYITLPAEVGLVLWGLALWQVRGSLRRWFLGAIPAVAVLQVGLLLMFEDVNSFSAISGPILGIIGFAAALFTLVTRAIDEMESLLRQDWFWISAGFALYFGSLATIMPMARLLVGDHRHLVMRAFELFSIAHIVANVAIAVGMLCPTATRPSLSGVSSSPSFSASASRSSRSSPP